MSYPTWPMDIPKVPLVDSWSMPDMYQDPRATDMEGANKRLRTRPGDEIYSIQFAILMLKAEWTTLQAWILDDLGRGTSRFNTRIWDGTAMIDALVQFKDKPQPVSVPPHKMQITFSYWVFPNG